MDRIRIGCKERCRGGASSRGRVITNNRGIFPDSNRDTMTIIIPQWMPRRDTSGTDGAAPVLAPGLNRIMAGEVLVPLAPADVGTSAGLLHPTKGIVALVVTTVVASCTHNRDPIGRVRKDHRRHGITQQAAQRLRL